MKAVAQIFQKPLIIFFLICYFVSAWIIFAEILCQRKLNIEHLTLLIICLISCIITGPLAWLINKKWPGLLYEDTNYDSLICFLKRKSGTGKIEFINSTRRFNSNRWIRKKLGKQGKNYRFIRVLSKEYKDVWGDYKYVYTLECWEPIDKID